MREENVFFVRTEKDTYEYGEGMRFELERFVNGWREKEVRALGILRDYDTTERHKKRLWRQFHQMRDVSNTRLRDALAEWRPSVRQLLYPH